MKKTLSGTYIAILALVAAGILLVGSRFRPRPTEPAPPSPTETALLQQSVRRDQAAGIGQYLATRAAELADQAVFLHSLGTSGVRYREPKQVLTVDGTGELVEPSLIVAETASSVTPAPVATSARNPDGWVLIVARSPMDQLLWTAGIQSITQPAMCRSISYQELVFAAALDSSFAGAGAFDLDGNLAGIVMACDGVFHVVSIESVPDLLARSTGPGRVFLEKFGFRAAPLRSDWQDLYPGLKGLMITDVWKGGWADRNGLLPGDLIVTEEQALREENMGTELKIARPGRRGLIRVKADLGGNSVGVGLIPSASPLPELLIPHGSPAEGAGLRSGDHLVSILGQPNASIAALSKLLAAPRRTPIRLVYERGQKRSVAEVPHE